MDADDATQEVMIRIWHHMENFKLAAAKAWIMKTTHNLCIDILRKRSNMAHNETLINEEDAEQYSTQNVEHNPYLKTQFNMIASKVIEAIQRLPIKLRSVFILREIQGLKYKEIGTTLDIPINSVKVYLLRARKKLQEDLKNYEPHGTI